MLLVAWLTEQGPAYDAQAQGLLDRVGRYLDARCPSSWQREVVTGEGYGLVVAAPRQGGWRWAQVVREATRTVVSVGMPVGLDAADPGVLADAVLAGEDATREVVPPFGLVVLDEAAGRFVVQQDWMGMAPLFSYRSQGVQVLATRPTLARLAVGDALVPDEQAWSTYASAGFFAEDSSPVAGVSLLSPAVRFEARRGEDGTWQGERSTGRDVDALVRAAMSAQLSHDDAVEQASSGLRRAARSLRQHWDGELIMGLSGGRDSRLLAAVVLSAEDPPDFFTYVDDPAEGAAAKQLVDLAQPMHDGRLRHTERRFGAAENIARAALRDRARALQRRYDLLWPASYVGRTVPGTKPAAELAPARIGGAFGELATARWIPAKWFEPDGEPTREQLVKIVRTRLSPNVKPAWQAPATRRRIEVLAERVVAHAESLGLDPARTLTYAWMVVRMRRWSSAPLEPSHVTLLLTPEFLSASFTLDAQQRKDYGLHSEIVARLVPQWVDVPYVKNTSGLAKSKIARIWDGDGAAQLGAWLRGDGPLRRLLDRDALRDALARAGAGKAAGPEDTALMAFAMLASAEDVLADIEREVRPPEPVVVLPRQIAGHGVPTAAQVLRVVRRRGGKVARQGLAQVRGVVDRVRRERS